jgi:hypothetical protein
MQRPKVAAQVEKHLTEPITTHPWLLSATDGRRVDPSGLDPTEILAGLASLLGALTDCVKLLAAEIDRQNELLSGDGQ